MPEDSNKNPKIIQLQRMTLQEEQAVRQKRIDSLLVRLQARKRALPIEPKQVGDIKMNYAGYEIPDLEEMLLSMPRNWENLNEADTFRCIAIGKLLEEKYEDRNQVQTGRE